MNSCSYRHILTWVILIVGRRKQEKHAKKSCQKNDDTTWLNRNWYYMWLLNKKNLLFEQRNSNCIKSYYNWPTRSFCTNFLYLIDVLFGFHMYVSVGLNRISSSVFLGDPDCIHYESSKASKCCTRPTNHVQLVNGSGHIFQCNLQLHRVVKTIRHFADFLNNYDNFKIVHLWSHGNL